jgi:hypothetical protein
MHVIFAFAGENLVEKYGAYAGFAAIPGLAVLALLYFAQGREVKRLRTWAEGVATGETPVGTAAAPARPAATRPASRPATAAGRPATARPGAGPPKPSKPSLGPPKPAVAGAAAGAAAAASKNDVGADKPEEQKDAKPDEKAVPAVPAAATAAAKGAELEEGAEERERAPAVAGAGTGAAAPTALREREGGAKAPPSPGRAEPGDVVGSPDRPGPPRSARPSSPNLGKAVSPARSAAALRANRPSAAAPPRGPGAARLDEEPSSRRRPIALIAAGVVVLLIGLVIGITQLGGGGDSKKAANTIEGVPQKTDTGGDNGSSTPKKPKSQPVNRAAVTVAVLNGTTAPGLAATVGDQLEGEGFKRGTVANASDQQQQATTVFYGPSAKPAAQEVAKILKVSTVKPLDAGTQAIAGADAGVVVVVGGDRTS